MNTSGDMWVITPSGERFGPASIDVLKRWAAEGRIPSDALIEMPDGSRVLARNQPDLRGVVNAPPTIAGTITSGAPAHDSGVSTLIPYRNVPALAAYYCGVFALVPALGIVLAPAALILGIFGWRNASQNPHAKGRVHAVIGIVLGSLITAAYTIIVILAILG